MKRRFFLMIIASFICLPAISQEYRYGAAEKDYAGYLFAYFKGNRVADEAVCYAVSRDGYNYLALNNNMPVLDSKEISSTGGVRDPHILRCEDGKTFYMVLTDMTSSKGWDSNRAMVLMKSNDLVNWTSNVVNIQQKYRNQEDLKRVWAPQTIYDPAAKKYMIYWSMKHGNGPDIIYYAYASQDFTYLESEPKPLFIPKNGKSCIDGDIVHKNGLYYMFYKTEGHGDGIRLAITDSLGSGKWIEQPGYKQQTKEAVEGSFVFRLINSDTYILMYDVYKKGVYQFCESKDLDVFKAIDQDITMNFHPRHGSVIPVTSRELEAITDRWGVPEGFDSAYIYAYTSNPEKSRSPLCFKWSIDKKSWHPIGPDHGFLYSDYGRWGSQKRMLNPVLMLDQSGMWHCVWDLNETDNIFGHAASPDLVIWNRQSYLPHEEKDKFLSKFGTLKTGTGNVFKVSWQTVEGLINAQKLAAYNRQLYAEQTKDDEQRFEGLKPVDVTITINAEENKKISDLLTGVFFEDINYAADGGIYAELVQNRGFEYQLSDKEGRDKTWDATKAWTVNGNKNITIDTVSPIHTNNKHYVVLKGGDRLLNEGFDGIALRSGEKYDFSVFARTIDGKKQQLTVRLTGKKGENYGETTIKNISGGWKKYTAVLTAKQTVPDASLEVVLLSSPEELVPPRREEGPGMGRCALDMISLFPQKTFKGRKNGLRADLARAIADMHPRFVRFPGGCVAHGDGLKNMYRWKNTIGPLESRIPQRNLWGYHQTAGLGYYEYFLFCKDIGAEPLPVVPAGVPCQNSANHGHRFGGQQCGIPMHEMDEYVQEVLDLIEWANGDKNTFWGRKRAEAGHPEPFNLKYIGVGNEDLITDVFEERFTMIYNAVKAKHPEITVIGTVGPFSEGTDYREGWDLANRLDIPIVDEHYYQPPGWFIHNQDFYDKYDRSKSKVYLGEYAAHLPGRPNNLETALAEALYLTALERNGDVVVMTSYAPLLAKEGHTQWNPDLIYFNNTEVKPTVGYYVQQLYGQNTGDIYFPSAITCSDNREDVRKRIAVSAVQDSKTGDVVLKMVNLLPEEVNVEVNPGDLQLTGKEAIKAVLTGKPDDKNAIPETTVITLSGSLELPAYSFIVLRIKNKQGAGRLN